LCILVLMLLILPWKAFASTIEMAFLETSHFVQAIEHEMEHEQGLEHHHHDDNHTIHYDHSEDSQKHSNEHVLLYHANIYEIVVSTNSLSQFLIFISSQATALAPSSLFPNSISLEGLRRPPRVLG
jgi:ABC-type Zn2+ transport system substrate-binding protein/surface adhesin